MCSSDLYDPQRIRAILRRGFAAVGRFLLERDDSYALIARSDGLDNLLVSRPVVRTHKQDDAEFALIVYRCANADLAQSARVSNDDNLVSSEYGGATRRQRPYSNLATSGQQDEAQD